MFEPGSVVGWFRGSLRSHLNQRVRVAVARLDRARWWAGFEARCARTSTSECGLHWAATSTSGCEFAGLAPQPAGAVCCGRVSTGLGGGLVSRLAALARCARTSTSGDGSLRSHLNRRRCRRLTADPSTHPPLVASRTSHREPSPRRPDPRPAWRRRRVGRGLGNGRCVGSGPSGRTVTVAEVASANPVERAGGAGDRQCRPRREGDRRPCQAPTDSCTSTCTPSTPCSTGPRD